MHNIKLRIYYDGQDYKNVSCVHVTVEKGSNEHVYVVSGYSLANRFNLLFRLILDTYGMTTLEILKKELDKCNIKWR